MSKRVNALKNALNGTLTDADRKTIERMIDTLSKPRAKSQAAIQNDKLAAELVQSMRDNKLTSDNLITTSWVMEHLDGVMTGQKASKVLGVAIKNGDIERKMVKSKVFYHLTA